MDRIYRMNRIILEILLILSKNGVFKSCFFRTEQPWDHYQGCSILCTEQINGQDLQDEQDNPGNLVNPVQKQGVQALLF